MPDIYLIRKSLQWVKFSNATAVTLTTAADELKIWSGEFRDIFNAIGVQYQDSDAAGIATVTFPTMTAALMDSITASATAYGPSVTGPLTTTVSDEVKHVALRQTLLSRTHWKISVSTGPSPLYATWADGDIFSNNPPETN
jgi:hypothetical protein